MQKRNNQNKQVWFNGSKYSVPESASYVCEDSLGIVTWHDEKPIPDKATNRWVSTGRSGVADLIYQVTWDRKLKPIGEGSHYNSNRDMKVIRK